MSPSCMVIRASDHIVVNGVAIPWDSDVYDDANIFDPTQPTRLAVPAGATRVRVGANIAFKNVPPNETVSLYTAHFPNPPITSQFRAAQTAIEVTGPQQPRCSIVSGPIPVQEGDYFELVVGFSGGVPFSVEATRSNFWLEVL